MTSAPPRPRKNLAGAALLAASAVFHGTGCTTVVVPLDQVPRLVEHRSQGGKGHVFVRTVDGDPARVPTGAVLSDVVPAPNQVHMSPPGRPDIALGVDRKARRPLERQGWRRVPTQIPAGASVEVDGPRLVVREPRGPCPGDPSSSDCRSHRGAPASSDGPSTITYTTASVRGIALRGPGPRTEAGDVGMVMTLLGGALLIGGGAAALAGLSGDSSEGYSLGPGDGLTDHVVAIVGGATAVTGLAVTGVGAALWSTGTVDDAPAAPRVTLGPASVDVRGAF